MPSKGTSGQRGYNYRHQQIRKRLQPLVASGQATCWRCGQPIAPGAKWDLGHDDQDRSRYRGPEHVGKECPLGGNRATKGRNKPRGNADTTRDW